MTRPYFSRLLIGGLLLTALTTAAQAQAPTRKTNKRTNDESSPLTITITVLENGTVAPVPTLHVPWMFDGTIELTINDPLNRFTFVNGVAFAAVQNTTVLGSRGPTSVSIQWKNTDSANAGKDFSYAVFLQSLEDGSVKMIDPTVENGPVG